MALNTWWTVDPEQRYWMVINHGEHLDASLQAPKLDKGQWAYDLVSQVQPGDRVLHWSSAKRALVGWSVVTAAAVIVPEYTWKPRGVVARGSRAPRTTPGWMAPLGRLTRFRNPPTLTSLLPLLDPLVAVNKALEVKYGKPTYFPFYRYGETQIRAKQAYFVKFPLELFNVIPEIAAARLDMDAHVEDSDLPEDFQPRMKRAPHGRTTRAQDPQLRAAIERRAVDAALTYYDNIGGTDARELGKPFDIAVTVDGIERHCEVKGSSMLIDAVELTVNEVNHGKSCASADLIVVDGIGVTRDKMTGEVIASGGRLRVWTDWSPAEDALTARRFAYLLPEP